MTVRVISVGLIGLMLGLLSGCGEADPLKRQGVSGKVSLNGEPLAGAGIRFISANQGPVNTGAGIGEDGTYTIPKDQGLPPGDYMVQINCPDKKAAANTPKGMPLPELVPAEYNLRTKQKVTVTEAGPNTFDFEIKK